MKVWIINPFDNLPIEGFRPQRYWLMSKAFVEAGHEVVLWSCTFSHTNKRFREIDEAKLCAAEKDLGGKIRLVPTIGYKKNISFKRILSHKILSRNWRKMAEREKEKPDVIIASIPPIGLCTEARKFCEKNGAKFIVDIQDAWPETFERVVPKIFLSPLFKAARKNYVSANALTAVSQRYVDLVKKYGVKKNVRLFYHGIDLKDYDKKSCGGERDFTIVYAGNFGESYDLETLVAAVKKVKDVRLEIAGTGPKEESLKLLADGCERIHFNGYLRSEELEKMLKCADVGIIPMFADSYVGMPGKLADYTSQGLAVLNSLEGEVWQMVDEYGVGLNYKAGNEESLVAAIEKMRSQDIGKMRERSKVLARRFNASVIYKGFVVFVEKRCSASLEDEGVSCSGDCASCSAKCSMEKYYTNVPERNGR